MDINVIVDGHLYEGFSPVDAFGYVRVWQVVEHAFIRADRYVADALDFKKYEVFTLNGKRLSQWDRVDHADLIGTTIVVNKPIGHGG